MSIAGFVVYGAGLLMLAGLIRGGGDGGTWLLVAWRWSEPGWRRRSAR